MRKMKIRVAHIKDKESVVSTVASAYRKYIEILGAAPIAMTQDYDSKIDAETIHVVEVDEKIIAAVELIPKKEILYLGNLSVLPEMQGEGYGKKLLTYAEWFALSKNLKEVRLLTNDMLIDPVRYYEDIGYRILGKKRIAGYERLLLLKKLM